MSVSNPPDVLCCEYCAANPLRSKYDTEGKQYYCPHREGGTVLIREGDGWYVRTGVSAEEYSTKTQTLEAIFEAAQRVDKSD